jgi:hypothetical protein
MTVNFVKIFTVSFIVCGLVPCVLWALTVAKCANTKTDLESGKKAATCVIQMNFIGYCIKFLALVAGGYYLWKYPE